MSRPGDREHAARIARAVIEAGAGEVDERHPEAILAAAEIVERFASATRRRERAYLAEVLRAAERSGADERPPWLEPLAVALEASGRELGDAAELLEELDRGDR